MSGFELAIIIPYAGFIIVGIYAMGWKQELNDYRRKERAKKEIAAYSTLESRLLKSSAIHKY